MLTKHTLEIMTVLVVVLLGLMALSAAFGIVYVRRALPAPRDASQVDRSVGLVRLRARVHTGAERCLVALTRELGLPRDAAGMRYGLLYVEGHESNGFTVRTHSVLDRGLIAPVTITSGAGYSEIVYSISRLPRDEDLRIAVLDFEVQLIAALRRIDASAEVRLIGTTLADLDGLQRADLAAEERAARR